MNIEKYSIGQTAKLAGVSVRTLRYYDEIGLLSPCEVSDTGYRYYDGHSLSVLSQIAFFRELGFSLNEISDLLSNPDFDEAEALKRQEELLKTKLGELNSALSRVSENSQAAAEKAADAACRYRQAKKQYADEVRQHYGNTPQYKESISKPDDEKSLLSAERIFEQFARLRDASPTDERVQSLVALWQAHITKHHYKCDKNMLACLGQMYLGDERFTRYLDGFGEGTAQLISQAIEIYCK